MAVDFKTFGKMVKHVTAVRKPVLLRGRHGIGKSTVVYQYAAHLGMTVVERRASQMTEGDLVGLPSIEDNRTTFNPPDWFKSACDYPVILFLDEVDRATLEVRQGIFELTDSRKLNGHVLHDDTIIFAAVNGGEHGSQYQVGEMDPAELDRWTVFDIEPSVDDWLTWAKDRDISPEVWNFINQNHDHLEHKDDFEPNKVYPSRRSWERLDECLSAGDLFEDHNALYHLSTAFVGFEAAVSFRDFVVNFDKQVTVDDILNRGDFSKVKDFDINDYSALVSKFESEKVFSDELSDEQIVNVAAFMMTGMPSEVVMKMWSLLGQTGGAEQVNLLKIHKAKVANRTFSDFLVEILSDDKK
tara:strand:- start:527 stop:1594 length:1068 start_codon:yes stop_codon:yes gene_type:complete